MTICDLCVTCSAWPAIIQKHATNSVVVTNYNCKALSFLNEDGECGGIMRESEGK
jgi:hypothetical protein